MNKSNLGKTIIATAVGAAAGAAVVGLSTKDNRKKVGKIINDLSEKAQKLADQAKKDPQVRKALKNGRVLSKRAEKQARPMAKKIIRRASKEALKRVD